LLLCCCCCYVVVVVVVVLLLLLCCCMLLLLLLCCCCCCVGVVLVLLLFLTMQTLMTDTPRPNGGKLTAQIVRTIAGKTIGKGSTFSELGVFNLYLQLVENSVSFVCILILLFFWGVRGEGFVYLYNIIMSNICSID
jgi:hypothetical protein